MLRAGAIFLSLLLTLLCACMQGALADSTALGDSYSRGFWIFGAEVGEQVVFNTSHEVKLNSLRDSYSCFAVDPVSIGYCHSQFDARKIDLVTASGENWAIQFGYKMRTSGLSIEFAIGGVNLIQKEEDSDGTEFKFAGTTFVVSSRYTMYSLNGFLVPYLGIGLGIGNIGIKGSYPGTMSAFAQDDLLDTASIEDANSQLSFDHGDGKALLFQAEGGVEFYPIKRMGMTLSFKTISTPGYRQILYPKGTAMRNVDVSVKLPTDGGTVSGNSILLGCATADCPITDTLFSKETAIFSEGAFTSSLPLWSHSINLGLRLKL